MAKKYKKPLLCDVDGVLADFVGTTLEYAKQLSVSTPSYEEMVNPTQDYEYWKLSKLDVITKSSGFCKTIKARKGAQEFIEKVRKADIDVVIVTSPMKNSDVWYAERRDWLAEHFDVKRDEIVFATNKTYVGGLTLLDDHIENIFNWQQHWDPQAGIMMAQPWNKKVLNDCTGMAEDAVGSVYWNAKEKAFVHRTDDWDEIYEALIFKNRKYNK